MDRKYVAQVLSPPPPLLMAVFFPVQLEHDLRILLNTMLLAVTLVQKICLWC